MVVSYIPTTSRDNMHGSDPERIAINAKYARKLEIHIVIYQRN
jgi:hypothetical protein